MTGPNSGGEKFCLFIIRYRYRYRYRLCIILGIKIEIETETPGSIYSHGEYTHQPGVRLVRRAG
jgi:hypothetical protein